MPKQVSRGVIAGLVLMALTMSAACGSSAGSPGGSGTPGAAGTSGVAPATSPAPATESASDAAAQMKARIQQYLAAPAFKAPGPPIAKSSNTAKAHVFTIPFSSSNPFCQAMDTAAQDAAKVAQLQYTEVTNSGTSAEWVRGINTAVAQKATALNLTCGVGPAQVAPQIAQAKSANVPTVIGYAYDPSQPMPANVAARVDGLFALPGTLMADWAITHSSGPLHAVVITDTEYPAGVVQENAMKAEFTKYCGGCTIKYQNVATSDWSTKIQPIVQTAITGDPKLTYVLPIYDAMAQFVLSAVTATSSQNRIRVATFNGTPAVLDQIRTGNIVEMDIGESPGWIGYAIIDEDLRLAAGMSPVQKEVVGIRVFDKSNVQEAGAPASLTQGYGTSFSDGYKKLWGQ